MSSGVPVKDDRMRTVADSDCSRLMQNGSVEHDPAPSLDTLSADIALHLQLDREHDLHDPKPQRR